MSETRDSRITDAMADAAEEAHSEHDSAIREAENGLWHWFCTCRSGRDESAATDEDTCFVEMRRHEYRAMVAAALAVASGCSTCGGARTVSCAAHVAGDDCDELVLACPDCGPGYRVGDEGCRHGTSRVIGSWPQWWCRSCGNRYGEHVDVDGCSCGGKLQAVTLQLVARKA